MQTLYRVCYKRKDSPNWPEQTIDMKLETKESIVSEFGDDLIDACREIVRDLENNGEIFKTDQARIDFLNMAIEHATR